MSKQAYRVEGDFQMGRKRQHFTVECVAESEDGAREHTLTDFGSRHGVARRQIEITSVVPVKADDVKSAIVRSKL